MTDRLVKQANGLYADLHAVQAQLMPMHQRISARQAIVEQAAIDASRGPDGKPAYGSAAQERKDFLRRAVDLDPECRQLSAQRSELWAREGAIKLELNRVKFQQDSAELATRQARHRLDQAALDVQERSLKVREDTLRMAERLLENPLEFRDAIRVVIAVLLDEIKKGGAS